MKPLASKLPSFSKTTANNIKFVFIHNIFKLGNLFSPKINKPLYAGVTLFISQNAHAVEATLAKQNGI